MRKIIISRKRKTEEVCWSINNWDEYVEYLKDENLIIPLYPYNIVCPVFIKIEYEKVYVSFEKQIAALFNLRKEHVEYEIVNS